MRNAIARKKQVLQPIAIKITHAHAATIVIIHVLKNIDIQIDIQIIGEQDTRLFGFQ